MVTSFDPRLRSLVLLPSDQRTRAGPPDTERLSRMRRWAIAAAALFHVALLVWLWFIDRGVMFAELPPDAVPVKIVYEQPKPPPPAAAKSKPAPPPQAAPVEQPQKPLGYRESGKDLETKALRPADKIGPEEAAPPDQSAAPETVVKEKPQPLPEPQPVPQPAPIQPPSPEGLDQPRETVARPEPQHKPTREARAAQPAPPRPPGIEFGDKAESGDPYLNKVQAMIDREMYYPPQARALGLQGIVYCEFLVGRTGEVVSILVGKSSGVSILDDAAVAIIRRASPFPSLPDDRNTVLLRVGIPMYPDMGRPHG